MRRSAVLLLLTLVLTWAVAAAPFTDVIVYGDSLTYSGYQFPLTHQPPPPYYQGRISNGPVVSELLASEFGATLRDYSLPGATTGIGNHLDPGGSATGFGAGMLPGITTLYGASLPTVGPLAASSLFLIWGGANDLFSPSPLDVDLMQTADRGVSNIVAIATGLQSLGAQHILVAGLPDIGLTPGSLVAGPPASTVASEYSNHFNAALLDALPRGVIFFDTAALLHSATTNPGAFGLTNVTDACFNQSAGTVCGTPDRYLFWDDLHPTTVGHQILAEGFAAAAVPEPATVGAAGFGLILIVAGRKRLSSLTSRGSR